MTKQRTREQIADIALPIVAKSPDWVSNFFLMAYMNCSDTKTRNLCKTLAEVSADFEYQNGDIRFIGDRNTWKASSLWEAL